MINKLSQHRKVILDNPKGKCYTEARIAQQMFCDRAKHDASDKIPEAGFTRKLINEQA